MESLDFFDSICNCFQVLFIFGRTIEVGDKTLETISYKALCTKMAAFELVVRTTVHGYHVYKEVTLGNCSCRRIRLSPRV